MRGSSPVARLAWQISDGDTMLGRPIRVGHAAVKAAAGGVARPQATGQRLGNESALIFCSGSRRARHDRESHARGRPVVEKRMRSGGVECSLPGLDRDVIERSICQREHGWVRVVSVRDSATWGSWVHPANLKILSYFEGLFRLCVCSTSGGFVVELRELTTSCLFRHGARAWLDCGGDEVVAKRLRQWGLGDALALARRNTAPSCCVARRSSAPAVANSLCCEARGNADPTG